MSGKYNIGFEINKKRYFRKQFGPSTIIGGYNISFQKRHFFIYQSHTEMVGYMIRKPKWLTLMKNFHNFELILKQKFFQFYLNEIYRPLINEKNITIEYFKKREDYNHVLTLSYPQIPVDMTKFVIESLFEKKFITDCERHTKKMMVMNSQISWLVGTLNNKLEQIFEMRFHFTFRIEYLQKLLWEKIT